MLDLGPSAASQSVREKSPVPCAVATNTFPAEYQTEPNLSPDSAAFASATLRNTGFRDRSAISGPLSH
jgi:hypothetical protein